MQKLRCLATLTIFLVAGCETPPAEPGCVPGAASPCSCEDGTPGAQACADDGAGLLPCVCLGIPGVQGGDPTPDGGGAEPGGGGLVGDDGLSGPPSLTVVPMQVGFGHVAVGQSESQTLTIGNTGGEELLVTHFGFTGAPQFDLTLGAFHTGPSGTFVLTEPLSLAPGASVKGKVTFAPLSNGLAEAKLVLFSNDPVRPAGLEIPIRGNLSQPCIEVTPGAVDFGTVPPGTEVAETVTVTSCGDLPLLITSLALDPDLTADSFSVDLSGLPRLDAGPPTPAHPVLLEHLASILVPVRYAPTAPGSAGVPFAEEGRLVIESNAAPPKWVALVGQSLGEHAPLAVATVDEGAEVAPPGLLHLRGDQSLASPGGVARYRWTVKQPAGSQSVLVPSPEVPNPTFGANVAGKYAFSLTVWDDLDRRSDPAVVEVLVVPDHALHVELLWDTPNDPDQTDEGPEAGADLDLHFVHPYAGGPDLDADGAPDGWFDQPFDCFWFNPYPQWGSFDPAVDDDPSLEREDTDGAGPEILTLNIPENGRTYRVGVHTWHDHELGPSYATLRIFLYGELVWERTGVKLANHDLWEAVTIAWPSGEVEPVVKDGGDKITLYEPGYYFQP